MRRPVWTSREPPKPSGRSSTLFILHTSFFSGGLRWVHGTDIRLYPRLARLLFQKGADYDCIVHLPEETKKTGKVNSDALVKSHAAILTVQSIFSIADLKIWLNRRHGLRIRSLTAKIVEQTAAQSVSGGTAAEGIQRSFHPGSPEEVDADDL
jgi:hypothetical protein